MVNFCKRLTQYLSTKLNRGCKFIVSSSARECGAQQEAVACRYLQQQGLKAVARNYHGPQGEIDLIMATEQTLVFVEVRYRKNLQHGHPFETITAQKRQRIIQTAQHFLTAHPQYEWHNCRFDAISITGSASSIEWMQNAFGDE